MSIRPVDIQMSIQKVDHYTKDFNPNNQALNLQENLSQMAEKRAMEIQRQVVSAESAMQDRIDKDGGRGKGTRGETSKKDKDERGNRAVPLKEEDKGAFVDIII